MKGAKAVLPPRTINIPTNNKIMIAGNNHHFFLLFRNPQRSFKKSITILIY